MAAGCLMIAEAGGRITNLRGEPHKIAPVEIFASNGLVHDEMLDVFRQVLGAKAA